MIKSNFSLGDKVNKVNFETLTVKHGSTRSVVYIFEKTAYISDINDLSIVKVRKLKNLKVAIVGDILHSRVALSNIYG